MNKDKIFNKYVISAIGAYFGIIIFCRYITTQNIKDIIEVGILFLSAIAILIFGKKALIYCIIIFTSIVMHLDHKSLYASLLVFTISAYYKRKYLIPLSIIYHLNTIIVLCFSDNVLNESVIVFYSICLLIFLLILCGPTLKTSKQLKLEPDEILILDELIKGKQLKEIDIFSKNTKTEKLKHAVARNNLIDKNELIFLYKWEHSHSNKS